MSKSSTYAEAGVDIKIEESASEILFKAAQKTWKNWHKISAKIIGRIVRESGISIKSKGFFSNKSVLNF
jgi:phosphoribosylaminoimidazole (AIR) synthetase